MKKSAALPDSFKEKLTSWLGNDAATFIAALSEEETSSVRLHPWKPLLSPFQGSTIIPWESQGRYLSERPVFALDPAWHAGAYYVQESSSMLTGHVCRQILKDQPARILDLCAAPGGKSTHLLSIMPEGSLLVSNEILPKRNTILTENIQRWGHPACIVTKGDAGDFAALEQFFDLIVVDAPCSGEGLFRKQPEAVQEWSPENVALCARRQKDILRQIHPALKTGGYLCYSTCTFEPPENEQQVQQLLETGLYELIPLSAKELPGVEEGQIKGTLRCWPHRVKGSGFFIALLKKVAHSSDEHSASPQRRHWNWTLIKKTDPAIAPFLQADTHLALSQSGEFLRIFPKHLYYDLGLIAHHVSVTHFGIDAGQLRKGIFTPAHGLTHSRLISENIPRYETDLQTALDYLRKKDIPVRNDVPNGWAVVRWNDLDLGWIKQVGNRVNNYLPVSRMLRM